MGRNKWQKSMNENDTNQKVNSETENWLFVKINKNKKCREIN